LDKKTKSNKIYEIITHIKDGLLPYSKCQSGVYMFNSPHLIVFAENLPKIHLLSLDRWRIFNIVNDNLLPYTI